jgi:hypothetical protein
MTGRVPKSADDRAQSARFIKAAQEAECDDDPAAFERIFAKIVPPKGLSALDGPVVTNAVSSRHKRSRAPK